MTDYAELQEIEDAIELAFYATVNPCNTREEDAEALAELMTLRAERDALLGAGR